MTLEELYERLDPIARDLIAANRNDPELHYASLIVSFFMYTLSASLEPPDPGMTIIWPSGQTLDGVPLFDTGERRFPRAGEWYYYNVSATSTYGRTDRPRGPEVIYGPYKCCAPVRYFGGHPEDYAIYSDRGPGAA